MKYLTYKNILTVVVILTLWAILFMINNTITVNADKDRYEIKCASDNTFLLDTKTGLVWRNVWNNNKDKVPCVWQLMDYDGSVVPNSEQKARDYRAKQLTNNY